MRLYEILTELSQRQRKEIAGTEKDQFFTRPEVAQNFASFVKKTLAGLEPKPSTMIEPSAGNGDLARHFPGIQMYDLDPQRDDIKQQDFLKSSFKRQPGQTFIMNPPFGRSSDLAIMFFNKAAQSADHIAQIVPRTFKRESILKRLDPQFRLVDQYDLPKNAFYLPSEGDGKVKGYDVNAVAQVFTRLRDGEEAPIRKRYEMPPNVKFTRKPEQADFAFRRKGRRAGQIITDPAEVLQTNPNSFIYVIGDPKPWMKIDWRNNYGNDVMGARNITAGEIAQALATGK